MYKCVELRKGIMHSGNDVKFIEAGTWYRLHRLERDEAGDKVGSQILGIMYFKF